MRNILTPLLLSSACLFGSVALAHTGQPAPTQPQPSGTETPSSACLAQQKGLEAELAAIDKMTSGKADEQAEKPKKKSKAAKVAEAVAGAAVSALLPPPAAAIAAAGAAAAKDDSNNEKADSEQSGKAEQADIKATAPAAEIPALLARRQEIHGELAAIKQGSCTR